MELVFDLYDFEAAVFFVAGGGAQIAYDFEGAAYAGVVSGWSSYQIPRIDNYGGRAVTMTAGVALPFPARPNANLIGFATQPDANGGQLFGVATGVSVDANKLFKIPVTLGTTAEHASMIGWTKMRFYDRRPDGTKEIRREHGVLFAATILASGGHQPGRVWAAATAIMNAELSQ